MKFIGENCRLTRRSAAGIESNIAKTLGYSRSSRSSSNTAKTLGNSRSSLGRMVSQHASPLLRFRCIFAQVFMRAMQPAAMGRADVRLGQDGLPTPLLGQLRPALRFYLQIGPQVADKALKRTRRPQVCRINGLHVRM